MQIQRRLSAEKDVSGGRVSEGCAVFVVDIEGALERRVRIGRGVLGGAVDPACFARWVKGVNGAKLGPDILSRRGQGPRGYLPARKGPLFVLSPLDRPQKSFEALRIYQIGSLDQRMECQSPSGFQNKLEMPQR